jgi:fluoroquinolone transport system ATP-binding protein
MITVKNLNYTYPGAENETLHGLNFEIDKGEIFGFLGPSGAGKSTTQNLIIGLLKEYGGSIEVMGREVSEWGQDYYEHVGVSFELPNHYLKLTALENLNYFRSLYEGETSEPMEVLEWVGLKDDANKKVSEFSKGMKVRLNVARCLIHRPKILFLDEPTSGLDPVSSRKIKDLVLELRSQGTTVFVTTHNMMVADELCDRVAFITSGNIGIIDSPSALKKQYGKRNVRVEYLGEQPEVNTETENVQCKEFPLDGIGDDDEFINLLKSGKHIETIHTQETTLENIFIQVTGEALHT